MLRADLAEADIPYVNDGFFFDFHAQRHQTGTLLAATGMHPKVAQSIMRHSGLDYEGDEQEEHADNDGGEGNF